jgi:hypothetical protein
MAINFFARTLSLNHGWSIELAKKTVFYLPIVHLGKRREALSGSAELYKKTVVEYLESRGYYVKMDSYVEGTLADCVLSRKGENKEYWLETKATTISLYEAKFASQLGKYLAEYLIRSPQNRFNMILAVHDYRKQRIFKSIYDELDETNIRKLREFIINATDKKVKRTIREADFGDIKHFFEDTTVIRATLQGVKENIEKIHPKPPTAPKLTDVRYAADVLNRYRTNQPLDEEDNLLSNLFALKLPDSIYMAPTEFSSAKEIYKKNPEVIFPIFRLISGKVYSFRPFSAQTALGKILNVESFKKVKLKEWDATKDTSNIVLYLVYRRIDELCRKKVLSYDERTESYFFSDYEPREVPKKVRWKKAGRSSTRRVIIPVKKEGTVYYYAHRAVQILVRSLWGEYFIQLIPRWIFSGDCYTPYPGDITDKLNRAYRKSNFTRNRNQLNDVLFWSWHLFSEGSMLIESYLKPDTMRSRSQALNVVAQISVLSNKKPNILEREEAGEEELEEIDTTQILDSFFLQEED